MEGKSSTTTPAKFLRQLPYQLKPEITVGDKEKKKPVGNPVNVNISINDIPLGLRAPHYDAMIVHAPSEKEDMAKFRFILENYVKMPPNQHLNLCIYSCDNDPNYDELESMVERTSIFFIYSSNQDFGDSCARHKKDEIVSNCILNPCKRLVPVLPDRSHEPTPGTRTLKALYLDSLFCGQNIADLSLKEIEQNGSDALSSPSLNSLIRLFNIGSVNKQKRQKEQQKHLKEWIRQQIRAAQIMNVASP